MLESKTNLWTQFGWDKHVVAISTNGFIKNNGEGVMGRGCALEATKKFPGVARLLGNYIQNHGNVPGYLLVMPMNSRKIDRLMVLPVKRVWWEVATPELVKESVRFLGLEADDSPSWTFHVPRLGCGNGRLDWDVVRGWMEPLPNNVVVHSL